MKKAALRRVIIYVLVFSLTFTSVSAAIARPVEVQAIVGADDAALAILLALLAAGGYYASSSAAAANIKTEFLSFVGKISGTASTSTEATADIIKNTVVYSGFIDLGYSSTQAFEASKHFLSALSLIEFGYTDESERSWSVAVDGSNYKISDTVGNLSWTCTVPNFKVNSVLPKSLNINLFVSEGKLPDDDPAATAIVVGLLAELKSLVDGFIKNCIKSYSCNKSKISDNVSSTHISDNSLSVKKSVYRFLMNGISKVYYADCQYDSAAILASYIMTNNVDFEKILNDNGYNMPVNFICYYQIETDSRSPQVHLFFSQDLTGYDLVVDSNKLYKVDSSGTFSDIVCYHLLYSGYSTGVTSFSYRANLSLKKNEFEDYVYHNSYGYSCILYELYGFDDFSNIYNSVADYNNNLSIEKKSGSTIYGSSDFAASADSDVYVPDGTAYDNIVKDIEANAANAEKLAAALAEAQAANAKALEDMKESIEEGNAATASLLQKILQAINNLDKTVAGTLPVDTSNVINSFAGTADVISDIDKLLNQKLPVIGDMADVVTGSLPAIDGIKDWLEKQAAPSIDSIAKNGEDILKTIDDLGDNVLSKLAPIDLVTNLDTTLDGIALDAKKTNEKINEAINGEKTISVSLDDEKPVPIVFDPSVTVPLDLTKPIPISFDDTKPISVSLAPTVQEPTDQDDFNLGIFNLLYLLFLILFKIIMIFCHCLELLFTIHSVKAYPYFLNAGMVQGLNWIKSVKITGDLLNVSLYDFLYVLVRFILVFSVIRLIRHYTDRLG